jgi:hypothetical protein
MPPPEQKVLRLPSAPEFEAAVAAAERRQAEAEAREAEGFWQRLRALPPPERYERLLELQAQGRELPQEDTAWMRYFEHTPAYEACREYYEDRKMLFLLDQQAGEGL